MTITQQGSSIARASCTRLASRPRPLRLWASGTVFQSRAADEGGLSIEENLHSGVELFGVKGIEAEMELLSLLLAAVEKLDLGEGQPPKLLIGHTALMNLVLHAFDQETKNTIRSALIHFDRLAIEEMDLPVTDRMILLQLLDSRGQLDREVQRLERRFGSHPVFSDLKRLNDLLACSAAEQGVTLQLDPTFQPVFELYTGLVFQLVCQGKSAPVVIARGGRYDDLVARCGARGSAAAGVGFSLAIDAIRELLTDPAEEDDRHRAVLVAFAEGTALEDALQRQRSWHARGMRAMVELSPLESKAEAQEMANARGVFQLDWIDP